MRGEGGRIVGGMKPGDEAFGKSYFDECIVQRRKNKKGDNNKPPGA